MSHRVQAALALTAALILPTIVTGPAEAAEAATVTTAPAAAVHHSRHWYHCHTKARPCAKHKAKPKAHPKPKRHRPAPHVTNARAKVLRAARSAIGKPYRYGAAGPNSFDCSGLVGYAYRAAGKRLPRTAHALAHAGRGVAHAKPGDVLVYAGASHVAIVSAVTRTGRVAMTIVARHSGTRITTQKPYTSYTVRAFLA